MKNNPPLSVAATRRFIASPERVFDAWLDPETAGRWLFATHSGQVVRMEIDARVGGQFVITDQRDGEDVAHIGEYLALDRPGHLAFVFVVPKFSAQYTRVNVAIAAMAGGCELTLTHAGVLPEYADRTESGWNQIPGGLAAALI